MKNKISRKRFLQIWVPFATILLISVIVCTVLMNSYSNIMDLKFGKGERKIVNLTGAEYDANYYDVKFGSARAAAENGKRLTRKIAEEGIVLLKNDGVLPLAEHSSVTPFGYHYLYPNYGPYGGSAMTEYKDSVTAEAAFGGSYTVNSQIVQRMKNARPVGLTVNGYVTATPEKQLRADVIEYDPVIYEGGEKSCAGSCGVVIIGRAGSEGAYAEIASEKLFDGTPHGAALSEYEKQTILFAKQHCDKVVVVLNCCNPMQIPELARAGEYEADAVIWLGGTGSAGFQSLVNLMTGKVSPSGRLTDIYVTDATENPVYPNYGNRYRYTNVTRDVQNQIYENFLEYEEGVYNGYRYYETADAVDENFIYGERDANGKTVVAGEVTYPFGYGLSYTSFKKKITRFHTAGSEIIVEVEVENVGSVAGREVVQIYYTPPYTDFSKSMGIEKPAVTLAGFVKTKLLSAGEKDRVTVKFAKEDMASYCSARDNGDGTFGCYILEEGDYLVSLRDNSHDVLESREFQIAETQYYDSSNPRASERRAQDYRDPVAAAVNRFDDLTRYMTEQATVLTRGDWKNTQPSSPVNFVAPDYALAAHENSKTFNPSSDALLGDGEGSAIYRETPVREKSGNAITLSSLRGADYDDPVWDELLDNLDYSAGDLWDTLHTGYMQTGAIDAVGLPSAQFRDGPLGITATMNDSLLGESSRHNAYCAMPVLAATFDVRLAYEYGEALAQEALLHNDGKLPVSGIYAPGMNVHRGPFGGRYYEYFSEDPLLIGLMSAGIASGASDSGLSVVVKHFAANNQDIAREGLNTWMTEQTLREIYLRPYEICIKNAKSKISYIGSADGSKTEKIIPAVRGIMTSKNNLGATFCGANYPLLTQVLKGEWNFKGMVITDFFYPRTQNFCSKVFRSGVNVLMQYNSTEYAAGMDSETARNVVRESVHALCYTVVNSNAMQGVPPEAAVLYGISPWMAVMISLICAVAAFILVMSVLSVILFRKRRQIL